MPPARARPSAAPSDDGASPACLSHPDPLGSGELLGPTLDGWWPILNPDNADTLSAFGRPGAVACAGLVPRRPESQHERSSPQTEPNLCDWRSVRADFSRSRRRRLVPLLPNGFACVAFDASDVASGDRSRQRGEVLERSIRRLRRRKAYPIDHTGAPRPGATALPAQRAHVEHEFARGEVPERSIEAVLKTVGRKPRGFESHPLRHAVGLSRASARDKEAVGAVPGWQRPALDEPSCRSATSCTGRPSNLRRTWPRSGPRARVEAARA